MLHTTRKWTLSIAAFGMMLAEIGCGGGVNGRVQSSPTAALTASASVSDIGPSQSSRITAAVANNGSEASGVTFGLVSGEPGTLTQVDSLDATYTAPAEITNAAAVTVTATLAANTAQKASATINLHPVSISISNRHPDPLAPLQSTQLVATTAYDGGAGVRWSLPAGAVGTLTPVATLTAAYTAPAAITQDRTYAVTATSLADTTKSASAPVSLVPAAPAGSTPQVWQNLVQFQNGLAREGTTPPPYAALETAAASRVYQSGLLIFHDITTKAEIWRLDDDPTTETANDGPLNRQPWDANGSHFQVWSSRAVPEAHGGGALVYVYDAKAATASMVYPTDATRIGWKQPLLQDGAADGGGYLAWDPQVPGLLYATTYDDLEQATGPSPNASLYAVDANQHFAATKIADLPNPTLRKVIQSYPANDGMLMVRDVNPGSDAHGNPLYIPSIYMVPTSKADPSFGRVKYAFKINFNLPQFAAFGHAVANEYHLHDIYFRRSADDGFIFNYGPLGDVGETAWFEAPVNGDASKVTVAFAATGSPVGAAGGTPYYSHPAWNFDGSLVAYFGESAFGANDYAAHVRNQDAHTLVANIGDANSGHIGWDGFDPSYVVFDGQLGTTNPTTGLQQAVLYSANPTVSNPARVLFDYEPFNPTTTPGVVEGPAQSPDATKVMVTMRSVETGKRSVYIVVDHRPFPPALVATTSGASVVLTWTPYLTHREVAGYHVYRSPKGAAAFHEISPGMVHATTFTDTTAAPGQTYDYAVTAEENSGLESDQLSNLEEVLVGGGVTQQQAAGLTGWMTTPPAPPTGLVATEDPSHAFFKLSWTASTSADVRYYKIYYGDGRPPQASQAYLIATPPAGVTTWVLWQVDPNTPPVFGLSAVDRQDNESTMACVQTATPALPCPSQ